MARHERNIRASAPAVLEVDELLSIFPEGATKADTERQEAIARCLSGSDGWDEAARRLGGAFAPADKVKEA